MKTIDNSMLIYHGSSTVVEVPQYGVGYMNNDYGLGFYCTQEFDLACEWAVREGRNGFANAYRLDLNHLKTVNLNQGEFTILHWIAVLLNNRTFDVSSPLARAGMEYLQRVFAIDLSDTDIVIGYRADDSYFSFARDFLEGTISVRQLKEAMHLGGLGEQVVLKSHKAFEQIKFVGCEKAKFDEWYSKRLTRDTEARNRYRSMNRGEWIKGELYMPQILDEEVKPGDARIQ